MRPYVSEGYLSQAQFVSLPHQTPQWPRSVAALQKLSQGEVTNWSEFDSWAQQAALIHWAGLDSSTKCIKSYFANTRFTPVSVRFRQESGFYESLLPWIGRKALSVESLFPEALPQLQAGYNRTVSLSKAQTCALLACFFLFQTPVQHYFCHSSSSIPCQELKFLSLVLYFHNVRQREENISEYFGKIALSLSFERLVSEENKGKEWWLGLEKPLVGLEVVEKTGILEYPEPALRVDFANCYIGGGVLEDGNVQEELYFASHPELYLSILLASRMLPNEAIVCVGAERVATYTGYGYAAAYNEAYTDCRYGDLVGRLEHHMVAIDASPYIWDKGEQYAEGDMVRELNKAWIGFKGDTEERKRANEPGFRGLRPIVSGNWGCGMFNGDPQLKSLLQWLSATAVGRRLVYAVHGDRRMGSLAAVEAKYRGREARELARDVWEVVETYGRELGGSRSVFELLLLQRER